MIVSWNWLKDYVDLQMSHDELVERLTMSGLNHESTERVSGDRAIDLEVTSNRPDCLGHLGVAREISVLFDLPLQLPEVELSESSTTAESLVQVRIDAPELCPRYTARVVQGVKIGPSPDWIADRLEAVGCNLVNNIVDITNFVMYETGQPIHAFDYDTLKGKQIIVRDAVAGEKFTAIDHKTYELRPGMCVIGDEQQAVGLGGVMGGAETEVSDQTTNILVEVAAFNPLAVRLASRGLNLMSDASHRFERPTDQEAIDWVSRRACQLILETAGGELAQGIVDVGQEPAKRSQVCLRLDQIPRVLGIEVDAVDVERILKSLGNQVSDKNGQSITVAPPSWRHDLSREVDLIEEIARVHGYDKIPEDAAVPMTATIRADRDRVHDRVRDFFVAAGFDESVTASMVIDKWSELFSPWCANEPLRSEQPMLGVLDRAWQNEGQVNVARRSLVPSLLEVRRYNEHRSNTDIEMFEIAHVYLPGSGELPSEPTMVALVSEKPYAQVKGYIESLARYISPDLKWETRESEQALLQADQSCQLLVEGSPLAFIGQVGPAAMKRFKLNRNCVVAEVSLPVLENAARLIAITQPVSPFPAISRDFNFIVDESVRWADLETTVRQAGGTWLEMVDFRELFRDAKKDGPGKKRLMLSITLRSQDETLTGEQADQTCDSIVTACRQQHEAELVA